MRLLREWSHRIAGTLLRRRRDEDLEEELRSHFELTADEAQRRGQAPHEALRTARLRSGGALQALEALRDQRGVSWLEALQRDVRYGVRTLRRSPSFTIVALVTLAFSIGANAAIYQLLDVIRLRTLPVKAPDQLAIVELADMTRWNGRRSTTYPALTNPLWEYFRDHQAVFSGVAAWANAEFRLERSSGRRVAKGLLVSGDFFTMLGVNAYLGRLLRRDDDRPGCAVPPAVVSYGFWQRQLGGDPGAIGRTLTINGRTVDVVGVSPRGFFGVEIGRAFDVAIPICAQASLGGEPGWLTNGTMWWLTVMGRLAPGQSLDVVNRRLDAASPGLFAASLPADYPRDLVKDYLGFKLRAAPGGIGVSALRARYSDPLVILQLTTVIVLLIACTNLANLVLSRASAREREFAVRLAVGGSWRRLVSVDGREYAAVVGRSDGRPCVRRRFEPPAGRAARARVVAGPAPRSPPHCGDARRGVPDVPGIRSRSRLARHARVCRLRDEREQPDVSGSRDSASLRRGLVVTQVACSLLLLFGGVLFTTTLRNLLRVDTGFESRHVFSARVDFTSLSVQPNARRALTADLLDRIREAPGVISASEVRHVPLSGTGSSAIVSTDANAEAKTAVRLNAMSPGYLQTMGVELIAGRDFDSRDSSGAPKVAIVNRPFARRLGLPDNPVRQTFRRPATSDVFEVIGLAPDSKYSALREDPVPTMFVPIAQLGIPTPFMDVMVRSELPVAGLSSLLARTVAASSQEIDVDVRAFDTTIRDGLVRERLLAMLTGVFGVLAALIAAVGLYGVMSYLVLRRTKEIGVRVALGARRSHVLGIVLGEAGTLLAIGLAIGTAVSLAAAGSVRALVFGLEPHNPGVIGLACALLALTGVAASYLPARRAADMPPLVALREE